MSPALADAVANAIDAGITSPMAIPMRDDHLVGAQSVELHLIGFAPDSTKQFVMLTARPGQVSAVPEHSVVVTDPLTGLATREAFVDGLELMVGLDEPTQLSVAFLDIDNFKTINDALGHDQGDLVLQTIAERLGKALGEHGLVARFGGDEFVVAQANSVDAGHAELMYLLTQTFADPLALGNKEFHVSASIGIATTSDASRMRPDAIIKAADVAMYEAKRQGKDRVEVYDETLEVKATERLELESDLRLALDREEFVLHYQPILDVISGRPIGAEALVRWVHPERGIVPPDEFISLAEQTGLIVRLGTWVLETALEQANEWNQQRLTRRALGISVNLSGVQLGDPNLERIVHAALSRSGFDPAKLTLEVTESVLMNDADDALAVLEQLRTMGVGIAIDDFGTGYSSLAYLKRFRAKSLKVDKAFVDGLGTNPEDTALVTGIVGLAGALGLEIVAEGVESELQLRELRRLGVEYSQGYYHSRPLANDDFVAWLAEAYPTNRTRGMQLPEVPPTSIGAPAAMPAPIRDTFDEEAGLTPFSVPNQNPEHEPG